MAETIKFRCKGCEKKIAVRAEYAGKKAKCPGCKQPLRVPSPRPKRSATGVPVAVGAGAPDDSSAGASSISLEALAAMEANADAQLKEISSKGISQPSGFRIAGGKDCPGCGSSSNPNAVICVYCGHNFDSGEKLKTKTVKAKPDRSDKQQPAKGYATEQGGWTRVLYLLYGVPFTLIGLAIFAIAVLLGGVAASGAAEGDGSAIAGSSFVLALVGVGLLFSGASLVWLGIQSRVDYSSILIRVMCLGGGLPLALIGGGLIVLPFLALFMGGGLGIGAIVDVMIGLLVLPAGVKLLVSGARGAA